jgi:hypothetical protein
MNFIDHFNQDQEEAKSALTTALNKKAFDLLDTYADNSEVEVVTFEDEEVANESVESDNASRRQRNQRYAEFLSHKTPEKFLRNMDDKTLLHINALAKADSHTPASLKNAAASRVKALGLTEDVEELDESGDYDSHYNAGRDAALDGKGAATCPHKKGDVNSDLQRKAWLMGHKDYKPRKAKEYKFEELDDEDEYEEINEASVKLNLGYYEVHHAGKRVGKYAAKYEAKEHAAKLNDDTARARAKAKRLKEDVEELDEGLGALAGLSKHLIKTVTKDPYSGRQAGEHSDVVTHPIKNKSAHRAVLNQALDDGHVPVVYVNGKIHSAGHSTGASYGRPEYHIHDADKQKEQKETKYPKAYKSGGKYIYPPSHQISNPRYKKGDALDQLTPGHDASFYKENKVEVKVIHPDPERLKKMKARGDNRPAMQANTVKMTPDEKAKKGYSYSDSKTVSHTPEGNMKAIKDAAALKLATQKLGTSGSSANKKAMELHAELGKHLAAGKHKEAIRAASDLSDHIRAQGLETHADKIADYADSLKSLKNAWGNKDYTRQKLAKMRGEKTNEEELVDALETMLTEMLDINEAKIKSLTKVPCPECNGTGKVPKKSYDNMEAETCSHCGGTGKVNPTTNNRRVTEAVVAGSVKKDAQGNVLSFKSVGDKAVKAHHDKVQKERQKEHEARSSTRSNGQPLDTEESVEQDETVDQIDEAKMFDPGKTVWTSHTEKALKGKIVKKDDDNADHYIVLHKDGQHAVHQDHIHAKEEYAKYMLEEIELGNDPLYEISKATLGSYIKKGSQGQEALEDEKRMASDASKMYPKRLDYKAMADRLKVKARNRADGIAVANNKLTK